MSPYIFNLSQKYGRMSKDEAEYIVNQIIQKLDSDAYLHTEFTIYYYNPNINDDKIIALCEEID